MRSLLFALYQKRGLLTALSREVDSTSVSPALDREGTVFYSALSGVEDSILFHSVTEWRGALRPILHQMERRTVFYSGLHTSRKRTPLCSAPSGEEDSTLLCTKFVRRTLHFSASSVEEDLTPLCSTREDDYSVH